MFLGRFNYHFVYIGLIYIFVSYVFFTMLNRTSHMSIMFNAYCNFLYIVIGTITSLCSPPSQKLVNKHHKYYSYNYHKPWLLLL